MAVEAVVLDHAPFGLVAFVAGPGLRSEDSADCRDGNHGQRVERHSKAAFHCDDFPDSTRGGPPATVARAPRKRAAAATETSSRLSRQMLPVSRFSNGLHGPVR